MLGEELKQLRGERGLGMARLAHLSGVSRTYLYAIEAGQTGTPYAETLLKLASGLSAWRGGEPDPDECADVFHRLQVAAGYPVDIPQIMPNGEGVTTPVPEPLAESILEILQNWSRWDQADRETAARLLDVASNLGRSDGPPTPPTVAHEDPSESRNGIIGFVSIISRQDEFVPLRINPDASRIASAPTRELAYAGR